MELGELTARVERVSHRYAAEFGIGRSSDWHILKLHEEVGELTQVHLMREGQARSKGLAAADLDARFAAEIADVVCHALLVARHHDIDVETVIEQKCGCPASGTDDQAGVLAGCADTAGSTTFADLVASTEPARMSTNAAIIGTVSGSLSNTTPAVTATAGLT
jgi:NTP pyrophosphatase (non-canonical NTP hydrolase)